MMSRDLFLTQGPFTQIPSTPTRSFSTYSRTPKQQIVNQQLLPNNPPPVPVQLLRSSKAENYEDLEYLVNILQDEANSLKVPMAQYELNAIRSGLKQLSMNVSSKIQLASRTFDIDFQYLTKRWQREYHTDYRFQSELINKEEKDWLALTDSLAKSCSKVRRLEQEVGLE